MFAYVRHDDGTFETVKSERINHLTVPVNSLKKYKLINPDGCNTSDIVIVFLEGTYWFLRICVSGSHKFTSLYSMWLFVSDSLDKLKLKIENTRVKVPPLKLLDPASEVSDIERQEKPQERQKIKEKVDKKNLLCQKLKAFRQSQVSVSLNFYYIFTFWYFNF